MDRLSRLLTWPVVTLLLGGGVIFGAIVIFAPPESRELLLGAHGLIATLIALYLRTRDDGPPTPPPAALLMLGCVLGAATMTGCGASAVRYHAEGAAIATVAVEGAQGAYLETLDRQMAACADVACIERTRGDLRAVETALDVTDAAVRAWRDAIEVALVAHESDALLSALVTAGLRVLARWADARAIAETYGLDLPELTLPGLEPAE